MSTHRIDPRAGFVNAAKATKCRECGTPRPEGVRWKTFCGPACVEAWKIRTQPSFAAARVLERDAGVCASCGLDCVDLAERLREWGFRAQPWRYDGERWPGEGWAAWRARRQQPTLPDAEREAAFVCWAEAAGVLQLKGNAALGRRRLWEMDHIVPVVEGGGSCGLDNLRTLCVPCHRRETAALARRRAEARNPQLKLAGSP